MYVLCISYYVPNIGDTIDGITRRKLIKDDSEAKAIFKRKEVLSEMACGFVNEFKHMTPAEAQNYIMEDSEESIRGLDTELTIDGSTVKLDTLTRFRLPEGNGKVGVLVNIESQVDYYPGYPLVYRALMYTAKILSMQPGWVFKGDDYGKLEKVYSIWILSNPPKRHRNKVVNIGLHDWISVPNGDNETYSCDLIEIVLVHLGERDPQLSRIVGILDTMMYGNMPLVNRVRVLREEYKLEVDELMTRGIDSMSSLVEQAEHAGYMKGAADVALIAMIYLIKEKGWSYDEAVDTMIQKDWDPQFIKDLKLELKEKLEEGS